MTRHVWDAIALGLALTLAGLAHRAGLDLALVGWDSYPAIAASQAGDVFTPPFSPLFESWMGGRYPRGDFYRPLSTLSLAFDDAWWGGTARGYQWGNLGALLFATTCVFGLARAWFGGAVAGAVATIGFALHAGQIEVVPVVARRSDLLATGLMAAALWAQPLGNPPGRRRLALGAVLALLAVAAKETGLAVLPAIVALHTVAAPNETTRIRTGLSRSGLAIAAVVAFLALRTFVLGGLGGHPDSNAFTGWAAGVQSAPLWLSLVVMPQPWTETGLDRMLAIALLLGLAWFCTQPAQDDATRPAHLAALGVWVASLLMMMGISGDMASWYVVPLVGPYAVLLGALVAWSAASSNTLPRAAAAGLAGLLLLSHVIASPLARDYPAWRQVSHEMKGFLAALDSAIAATPAGAETRVSGLPLGGGVPIERIGVRSALGMAHYSAAAYAEILHPDRAVRISPANPADELSDAVRVEIPPFTEPAR